MAQLVIFREKSMVGMVAPMDCYVNGEVACRVKNGEKVSCVVADAIVEFACNINRNPMSDTVYLDMTDGKTVSIKIKQGAFKPSITVADKSAITTQVPMATHSVSSSPKLKPPRDLRTALRTMQKSLDINESNNSIGEEDGIIYNPTREVGNYFSIDENARLWAISKGTFPSSQKAIIYSFDDIVDFEMIEDGYSVIKGGIGRAVVGGMLFGGVGAIVGSAAGKKKLTQTCTNLMIKITVNDMDAPVEYIKLISSTTNKNSLIYRGAYHDAQEIISLLQLICDRNSAPSNASTEAEHQASAIDEIRRYKSLMDEGIITEEEFLFKKKQLLEM